MLITSATFNINEKFVPQFDLPNLANFVFLTNNPDPFYLEDTDRRFWVHDIPYADKLPQKFFDDYYAWEESPDGPAALFHFLLNVDLAGFHPHAPAPTTQGKERMIDLGRTELERFMKDLPETNPRRTLYTSKDLLQVWKGINSYAKDGESSILRCLAKLRYARAHGGREIRTQSRKLRLWIIASPEETKRLLGVKDPKILVAEYERGLKEPLGGGEGT